MRSGVIPTTQNHANIRHDLNALVPQLAVEGQTERHGAACVCVVQWDVREPIDRRGDSVLGLALVSSLLVAGCHLIYPFDVPLAEDATPLDRGILDAAKESATGDAPADLADPTKVALTVRLVDWAAGKYAPGFNICVPQDASVPCATTAGTPTPSATLNVRDDMDISLLVVKAGYLPLELFRGKKSGSTSITHMVWPFSAKAKLEAKAGGAVDFTEGHLVVSVYSSAGAATDETGATAEIAPPGSMGPVYAGVDGWPDASLPATTTLAWAFFFNLAATGRTVKVYSKAGAACTLLRGWRGTTAQTSKVPIVAGRLASVSFICP